MQSTPLTLRSGLTETIKIARPGFWPTQLWFYLIPFAGRDMFSTPAFWLGAVYVCFPLGLLLYGWNDLGDVASDAENPRKGSWLFGARPDPTMRRWIPWLIGLVQIPFLIVFVFIAGTKMLLWFAAVLAVNATYNTLGFKRWAVLDLCNQVGYLLIFVLASWLCDQPSLSAPAMVFSAMFSMHSHLFGQLMDIEEDRQAGRRSTAVVVGARAAKWLLVGLLVGETVIAMIYFERPVVGYAMASVALLFVLDALVGPTKYSLRFVRGSFLLWNLIVLGTMYLVWRYDVFLVVQ